MDIIAYQALTPGIFAKIGPSGVIPVSDEDFYFLVVKLIMMKRPWAQILTGDAYVIVHKNPNPPPP